MKNTIIGIIVGIVIIGGIWMFMRNQELEQDAANNDINITLPTDTNGR